jgi:hypothetical protein
LQKASGPYIHEKYDMEGDTRALTRTPAPRALGMELASSRAALIALGCLMAALTSSLAGALAAAALLSAVALPAHQDLRSAVGTEEKAGGSVCRRHGSTGW